MHVFDTDVLSLLLRDRLPEAALARVRAVPTDDAATTTVTAGELYFGAVRRRSPALLRTIERLLGRLHLLPFDGQAARHYGTLRAALEARGRRLDDADLRIAATCMAGDHLLVSGNERHFARVPTLRFENWLKV